MSEIEKIQRYIDRAKLKLPKVYEMNLIEALELSRKAYESEDLPFEIICLAFDYGCVKGYRAAKAEVRKRAAATKAKGSVV